MLSIDITDKQIKLIRGVHSGSKIKIQDADMRELSLGMVTNGYITDVPMVAAELNDIIKSRGIKEKEAIVSITSNAIVYKELTIAKPSNKKNTAIIEAMIQSEMNLSTDYNISFTIAGESEDAEKNKMMRVIAAACPQRLVDGYVRLFQNVGLTLRSVNISNNSITRLITNTPKLADRMPMLLIQIDKGFLNMNLYEDNHLAFSRYSNIDPADYDDAPDYVTHAVYDNLYRMIQFIRSRKNARGLQEILFYGDIGSFVEISNAISSFNIASNMLSMPNNIVTSVQFDFSKFANAIGALYQRNKELEHINLLEATSAKGAKGGNGLILGLVGVMAASAAIVAGVCAVVGIIDNNHKSKTSALQAQIDDPQMQRDLEIVDERTEMLEGFTNYNDAIKSVYDLYTYQPKVTSFVVEKIREPIDKDNDLLGENETLEIESISISGYNVQVNFKGSSRGDPSGVPARVARYISDEILNEFGDPYFLDVTYTGFAKENSDQWGTYATLADGKIYDTVFSFSINMEMQMGNDEENANLNLGGSDDEDSEEEE